MVLSWQQRQFLAARLVCGSDTEAAEKIGMHPKTITSWKAHADFKQAYEDLPNDGLEFAKSTLRQLLGQGAMVHAALLEDPRPSIRLGALRLLYEAQGILVQRTQLSGDPQAPGILVVLGAHPDGANGSGSDPPPG